MDSLLISESLLKSLEARRRRHGERKRRSPAVAAQRPQTGEFSDCARALEGALRDSIRKSFSAWKSGLLPEVEGLARRVARSLPNETGSSRKEQEVGPPDRAGPGTGNGMLAEPVAIGGRPLQEHLAPECESPATHRASGSGSVEDVEKPPISDPAAGTRSSLPITRAAGVRAQDVGSKEKEDGGRPRGDSWNDLVEAVCELRRQWDHETFDNCLEDSPMPAGVESGDHPRNDREKTVGESGGNAFPALPSDPRDPSQGEVSQKLDQLIHLVQTSLGNSASKEAQFPSPTEVSTKIAREVAGRLQSTLAAWTPPHHQQASESSGPAPAVEPARIPIDDIAGMVDQLTAPSRL